MSAERQRVVLVFPRQQTSKARLMKALEQIEGCGYELTAVVDPERHLEALRMVVDGLADLVVVTAAEHCPLVQHVGDLGRPPGAGGEARARLVLRPVSAGGQARPGYIQRPRPVTAERGDPAEQRAKPVEREPDIAPRDRRTQVIRRSA